MDVLGTVCEECRKTVETKVRRTTNVERLIKHLFRVTLEYVHTDCLQSLIKIGADVNKPCVESHTPLAYCALRGLEDMIKLLIKSGADVNYVHESSHELFTPLMLASKSGHQECIDVLLKLGADVNKMDRFCRTALSLAFEFADIRCIRILISAGADVNHMDGPAGTLLHHATKRNANFVRNVLHSDIKINTMDYSGRNALQFYILNCDQIDKAMVMLLLAAGEKIDRRTTEADLRVYCQDDRKTQVLEYLWQENTELSLKHLCRQAIRNHLLDLDPHQHLFGRVPRLGLPAPETEYMLFDVTLDVEDTEVEENRDDTAK